MLELTVGNLFFLVFQIGGEVQGIEDAAWVSDFTSWETVALENGVLVDTARVLDVLPSPDFNVVEKDELDDEKSRSRGEVIHLASVVPERSVDETCFGENLWQKHARYSKHSPTSVLELRLHVPLEILRVFSQT